MLLFVLEKGAGCCMNDGFWEASSPAGVEDVKGMGRWKLSEV